MKKDKQRKCEPLTDPSRLPSWEELLELARETDANGEVCQIIDARSATGSPQERLRLRFRLRRALREGTKAREWKDNPYSAVVALFSQPGPVEISKFCHLPGYATASRQFEADLIRLREEMATFADADPTEPFTIFLCADRGAGKSYLVKCLVRSIQPVYSLVERNLSGVADLGQAVNAFLAQVYKQLTQGSRVIGFLDEVDTQVAQSHAYRHLIQPLRESFSLRDASVSLSGTILVFAASAASTPEAFTAYATALPPNSKALDFLDRIMVTLEVPTLKEPLEKVVRALAIALNMRPTIDAVDGDTVLYLSTRSFSSMRELENIVKGALRNMPKPAKLLSVRSLVHASEWERLGRRYPDLVRFLGGSIFRIRS